MISGSGPSLQPRPAPLLLGTQLWAQAGIRSSRRHSGLDRAQWCVLRQSWGFLGLWETLFARNRLTLETWNFSKVSQG